MISYFPLGDSALELGFGHSISEQTLARIQGMVQLIRQNPVPGLVELVPAYTKLVVHYNPLQISIHQLVDALRRLEGMETTVASVQSKTIAIPVLYGEAFGTDLKTVLEQTGLSEQELIHKHSGANYKVYMLGFTPGFCYLGGMDPQLATPRKTVPSPRILAGSVGIAGEQTGIYPIESPGGWQIIGRTPLKLFDPNRENPFLIEAGATLRFYPISETEFNRLNEYDA